MSSKVDKEDVRAAYQDVRDDNTDTTWAVFKYDENYIRKCASGVDYSEFEEHFGDDDRAFGFVRLTTGDELSKRAKFVLITWAGANVFGIKKAKLGTDKTLIKQVIQNFAVEIMASEKNDISFEHISAEVRKAGGANYGTGSRD